MKKILLMLLFLPILYADTITVGSKSFPESRILGELISILIENNTDLKVNRKFWLGGTEICFGALKEGSIDVYCEYTGTAWNVLLKKTKRDTAEKTFEIIKKEFKAKYNLQWLDPFGFNNTYVMVVHKDYPINTISEYVGVQDKITLGLTHEFMAREDGFGEMSKFYNLNFPNVVAMEHALAYQAIFQKKIDSTDAYSTDGSLYKYDLKRLKDDKKFFPDYFAAPIVRIETLQKYSKLRNVLNKLAGRIDDATMTQLNYRVEIEKQEFYDVAFDFLKNEKFISSSSSKKESENQIVKLTKQHIFLVMISTCIAMLIGVPLGILIAKKQYLATPVLGITGILQTIPSLAILAIMVPFLGIGKLPAIIALTLYGLLPIVRNAYTGIISVSPELKESAKAMGLTPMQTLTMLEIPMSTKIIMAGVRTATVICIGTATLAAFIGAGGLGELILQGLNLSRTDLILSGTIPAALLALIVDFMLARFENWIEPAGLKIQEEK